MKTGWKKYCWKLRKRKVKNYKLFKNYLSRWTRGIKAGIARAAQVREN